MLSISFITWNVAATILDSLSDNSRFESLTKYVVIASFKLLITTVPLMNLKTPALLLASITWLLPLIVYLPSSSTMTVIPFV